MTEWTDDNVFTAIALAYVRGASWVEEGNYGEYFKTTEEFKHLKDKAAYDYADKILGPQKLNPINT